MPALNSLKQSILTECEEDHVGLWSVIRDVEEFFPKKSKAAIRAQVLILLHELLLAKKIKAGFPTKDGRFRSLALAPKSVLDRIEAGWPADRRPTVGEGLWFTKAKKTDRSLNRHVRRLATANGVKKHRPLQRNADVVAAQGTHKRRTHIMGR